MCPTEKNLFDEALHHGKFIPMFAYNIKSPAYLTFVKILPSPKSSPNFCKRSVHLRIQFVRFHVISMNVESSKSVDKFHDFLAEADKYQIDMLLVAETWRI